MNLSRPEKFEAFIWTFMQSYLTSLEDGGIPSFHREWFHLTEGKRVVIAAPRSFAKSTIFSLFYPLFVALEEPGNDILMISANSTLSEGFLMKIRRELESNMDLIRIFSDQQSEIWRQDLLKLNNGSILRARGAECKIRGYRPSLVIIDDLENEENVWSEVGRNKLSEWFWKTLINVMDPEAQLIMVGTILHPESLLNTILKNIESHKLKGWSGIKYRALNAEGKSIWPSRWSETALKERRDEIGIAAFEQEYQNEPMPEDWRAFHEEQFLYIDEEPQGCAYFTTLDPAVQIDSFRDPDYTAIVTVAVDNDSNLYVIDLTRGRFLPSETIEELIRHIETHNPDCVGCETVGFQKVIKFYLDQECDRRGIYPYIKELNTGGMRKRFRIERLQPYFEKRKIYFKTNLPHLEDLKSELISFPTGSHDDMIDALASILDIMYPGGKIEEKRLDPESFDAWWIQFKRRRKLLKKSYTIHGNHNLRASHHYLRYH